MNAEQWLQNFAQKLGVDGPTEEEQKLLLEIAAEAAHSSERIAAPMACWLVGRSGADLGEANSKAADVTGTE